jgi:hypothetical protein
VAVLSPFNSAGMRQSVSAGTLICCRSIAYVASEPAASSPYCRFNKDDVILELLTEGGAVPLSSAAASEVGGAAKASKNRVAAFCESEVASMAGPS